MFGLSKKEIIFDRLQRTTTAALIGGAFPNSGLYHSIADEFPLQSEASAWLLTEAQAHLIYTVGVAFNHTCIGRYDWATPDFLTRALSSAILEYEISRGLSPGTASSFIFRRYSDFEAHTAQDRAAGVHFRESALLVRQHDSAAPVEDIAEFLSTIAYSYLKYLVPVMKT